MAGSLDLTDTDISDLFNRYPNITFDTGEDTFPSCGISEHFSSPCSNGTKQHTPISSQTASTGHTTPLRSTGRSDEGLHRSNLQKFLDKVDRADLPLIFKTGFGKMARQIAKLNLLLFPEDVAFFGHYPQTHKLEILSRSRSVLAELQQADVKVSDKIDNIEFVKARAPFMVEPGPQDLWCSYRQRAKLVVKFLSLPCRTEKVIFEELIHLFDAYVYHSFLELLELSAVDPDLELHINQLYDAFMRLLHNYNIWIREMRRLKEEYMQPLMTRIRDSPRVLREIADEELAREMAHAMIRSPEAPGMQPVDEKTVKVLSLHSSRRRAGPPRVKLRYERA